MKTVALIHLRNAAVGLVIACLAASQALAMPSRIMAPEAAGNPLPVIMASGDCYALGMQQAAREGGTLARATPEMRDGRQVCVIVIMLPARDGNRPVVSTTVVPLG